MAAQLIHAAGESGPAETGTVAVALQVPYEHKLVALSERLERHDIEHVLIREPDPPWNGQAMALGVRPTDRGKVRRHFKNLKLVGGKP